MATTIPSATLVPITPVFTNTERLALAGFLAGYSGLTRQAYELDLRQFASWCRLRRTWRKDLRRGLGSPATVGHDSRRMPARTGQRLPCTRPC
jgi:hypothetical protein